MIPAFVVCAPARSSWPHAIERMSRIDRIAVDADRRAIAFVHEAAQAVVARLAERAERTEHELVVVAFMGRMMVRNRRGRDAALLLAQGAQRLDPELMFGPRRQRCSEYQARHGSVCAGARLRGGMGDGIARWGQRRRRPSHPLGRGGGSAARRRRKLGDLSQLAERWRRSRCYPFWLPSSSCAARAGRRPAGERRDTMSPIWIELAKAAVDLVRAVVWPFALVFLAGIEPELRAALSSLLRRKVDFEGLGLKVAVHEPEQQQTAKDADATPTGFLHS